MSSTAGPTHPVARGFDRVARAYERGRPGYPPAAVRHLVRALDLRPGRTVVELGSGTGKLTRLLRPTGAAFVAVEPSDPMREVFARAVPGVLALRGTAEAIPLPDGIADAVVAAQAFHWFRHRTALREIARILRPGGTLALLWNVRDERLPLSRQIAAVIERHGGPPPRRWQRWERAFEVPGSGFGRLAPRRFHHLLRVAPERLVQHTLSVSRIAVLRPAQRRSVAREVRRLLARDPAVQRSGTAGLPTITEVYLVRRAARSPAIRGRPTRRTDPTRRSAGTSRGSGRRGRRTVRTPGGGS